MAKRNSRERAEMLRQRRLNQLSREPSGTPYWWLGVKYIPAGAHKNLKPHNR